MAHPANDEEMNLDKLAIIRKLFPRIMDFYETFNLPLSEPTFHRALSGYNYVSYETKRVIDEAFDVLIAELGADARNLATLPIRSTSVFYQLFLDLSLQDAERWALIQEQVRQQHKIEQRLLKRKQIYLEQKRLNPRRSYNRTM